MNRWDSFFLTQINSSNNFWFFLTRNVGTFFPQMGPASPICRTPMMEVDSDDGTRKDSSWLTADQSGPVADRLRFRVTKSYNLPRPAHPSARSHGICCAEGDTENLLGLCRPRHHHLLGLPRLPPTLFLQQRSAVTSVTHQRAGTSGLDGAVLPGRTKKGPDRRYLAVNSCSHCLQFSQHSAKRWSDVRRHHASFAHNGCRNRGARPAQGLSISLAAEGVKL